MFYSCNFLSACSSCVQKSHISLVLYIHALIHNSACTGMDTNFIYLILCKFGKNSQYHFKYGIMFSALKTIYFVLSYGRKAISVLFYIFMP